MILWSTTLAEPESRVVFGLNPIIPLFESWQWVLLVVTALIISAGSTWIVMRDTRNLPGSLRGLLLFLRWGVLGLLCLFLLEPQRSTETRTVKRSRLPILVDTSLSMSIEEPENEQPGRRIDRVIELFQNPVFWQELIREHDVEVYRFDENSQSEQLATSDDPVSVQSDAEIPSSPAIPEFTLRVSERAGSIFLIASGLGVLLLSSSAVRAWRSQSTSGLLAAGWFAICVGLVSLAICDLATAERPWHQSLALAWSTSNVSAAIAGPKEGLSDKSIQLAARRLAAENWVEKLAPRGAMSRIGDCLQQFLNRERGSSVAGILVFTDGALNGGVGFERVAAVAETSGVPIFPVGMGAALSPKNLEVTTWQLPAKAFPGDRFTGRALLQHTGLAGTMVRIQVFSQDDAGTETEILEDEQEVLLTNAGEPTTIEFELRRETVGVRRFKIRAAQLPGELTADDNSRSALIEVVDRKTAVLLIAGGPHRDFQFLRNQLFRDPTVALHVWLQSAEEGVDQEGHQLWKEFPRSREALQEIDCIIAFDPDWSALDEMQAGLLEDWVAHQAGGLIVTAGPVNTPIWTRLPPKHPVAGLVRRLYPVVFYNQSSAVLGLGRFGGERAFPLKFTREGLASEFLWLGKDAEQNAKIWEQFEGVFGYYAVNEAKPGAEVLAHFSDPKTVADDRLPIYFASQFYGSGRVFFQASNEAWRMRREGIDYFQKYYDQIIRWASQGRLNRNSARGLLLTDKPTYWVGDSIRVTAILPPALSAEPVATTAVDVVLPNGDLQSIELPHLVQAPRPGTYSGIIPASRIGDYRLRWTPGLADSSTPLTAQISVMIPDLEKQNPERNDSGLSRLAEKTQGAYQIGIRAAQSDSFAAGNWSKRIPPNHQESILPGAVDRVFRQKLVSWLLLLVTVLLASQWTLRRLFKLA